MKKLYTISISLMVTLSLFAQGENELPCGKRLLFENGTQLSTTYNAAYHYLENGSVTMSPSFVGEPGFSIKPSLNCNQTKPALEELVKKYAPQIRHYSDENYHLSSVDWYLNRSKLLEAVVDRVYYCEINKCIFNTPFGCLVRYIHVFYQRGIHERGLLSGNVNDGNILQLPQTDGNITALTAKSGLYNKAGDFDNAEAYVHVKARPEVDENAIEIQYHYFYPWNGDQGEDSVPCKVSGPLGLAEDADHEGDWEAVSVILIVTSEGESVNSVLRSVHGDIYHNDPTSLGWVGGTHPIIYSANESHAMYAESGNNHPETPSWIGIDQCDDAGLLFATWEEGNYEIVEIDPAINTAVFPTNPNWLSFNGRWGSYPLGPVGPKTNPSFWHSTLPDEMVQSAPNNGSNTNAQNIVTGIYQDRPPKLAAPEFDFSNPIDTIPLALNIQQIHNECKVIINFGNWPSTSTPVTWNVSGNESSYTFDQLDNELILYYDPTDSMSLTVSAEFKAEGDQFYFGSNQFVIPPCESSENEPQNAARASEDNHDVKENSIVYESLKLSPNPARDQLHITLPAQRELLNVVIYNIKGEQIATSKSSTIPVSGLAAGMYFVAIQLTDGERITKKIIVSRD